MQTIIKSIDRTITAEDIIPLLNKYGMLSRLASEDIIDRAIAKVECTPQEIAIAFKLLQHQQSDRNASGNIALAIRKLKLEKFKQKTFGNCLAAYFIRRKKQLDRVTYSIIKTKQKEVIREVHFRLIEGEQNFAELTEELTQECSGNPLVESEVVNSTELGTLPPAIAQQLSTMKAGNISAPILVENYYLILRLDRYVSATCDRPMQKRLLDELFERWMQQQLAHQKYHLESLNSLQ